MTLSSHRSIAAVVLSLSVALAGCGSIGGGAEPDATKKGAEGAQSLTIYTGRDINLVKSVIADFTAAKPEYKDKVKAVTIAAQEALDRLRAEKGNPQAGFLWGGTQQALAQAADEGLLEAYTPKSVADDFPADRRDAEKRWWGEVLLAEVIVYNNKIVKEGDAPKDWDDLITSDWKDKIVIRDVLVSGTMRTIYSSMIYRFFKDDSKPDAGYAYLKKLDANTASYAATPEDMYLKLARGVGEVTVWNLQDVLIQANNSKQPFSFVMPSSGAPVLLDGVGIVKGSKSTKVAQDFMDFLFEPDTQAKLAEEQFQIPTIELPADKEPQFLKDLEIKEMDVDFAVLAEHEEEWMDYWQSNIKGKG